MSFLLLLKTWRPIQRDAVRFVNVAGRHANAFINSGPWKCVRRGLDVHGPGSNGPLCAEWLREVLTSWDWNVLGELCAEYSSTKLVRDEHTAPSVCIHSGFVLQVSIVGLKSNLWQPNGELMDGFRQWVIDDVYPSLSSVRNLSPSCRSCVRCILGNPLEVKILGLSGVPFVIRSMQGCCRAKLLLRLGICCSLHQAPSEGSRIVHQQHTCYICPINLDPRPNTLVVCAIIYYVFIKQTLLSNATYWLYI